MKLPPGGPIIKYFNCIINCSLSHFSDNVKYGTIGFCIWAQSSLN